MDRSASVLVIHDRPLLFEGIRARTEAEGWSAVSAEGDLNGQLARWTAGAAEPPAVCLVDYSAERTNPVAAIDLLRNRIPEVPIVVLFDRTSICSLRAAALRGVRSFLSEHGPATHLSQALRAAMDGECFLCPLAARELLDLFSAAPPEILHSPDPRYEQLSCREREVFRLAATGLSNKEIAYRLGISSKTVATHHTRVCRKLGVSDPVHLYHYAVRLGIIGEDEHLAP